MCYLFAAYPPFKLNGRRSAETLYSCICLGSWSRLGYPTGSVVKDSQEEITSTSSTGKMERGRVYVKEGRRD